MQVQVVFAGKTRMLCIEIREFEVDWSRPAHVTPFGVELPSEEGMNDGKEEDDGQECDADDQEGTWQWTACPRPAPVAGFWHPVDVLARSEEARLLRGPLSVVGGLNWPIGRCGSEAESLLDFSPIQRIGMACHVRLGGGEAALLFMAAVGGRLREDGITAVGFLGGARQLSDH